MEITKKNFNFHNAFVAEINNEKGQVFGSEIVQ